MLIHDLNNNQGLISLRLGETRVIKNYAKFIHIVNLTNYEININQIHKNLDLLTNQIDQDKFKSSLFPTTQKFHQLNNMFNILKPRIRTKRGLINALGTGIKWITGNMDNNDYIEISEKIETLNTNQQTLNEENSKQILINQKMIERFNNITQHINKQQSILEIYINNFTTQISNEIQGLERIIIINQYIDQLNYDIDMLINHLQDISEAITLAKLNIISKHILHPEELNHIYDILKDQNIQIKSYENLYEFLELLAYFESTNIIFIIKIPIFLSETFSLYNLKQIPINHTYLLELTSPYLLLGRNSYQYRQEPCTLIENIRYCNSVLLKDVQQDKCIVNIIRNKRAYCNFIEQESTDTVELIDSNYLLISNEEETNFTSTCSKDSKKKTVKGTVLIYFNDCTIYINGIRYSSETQKYWDTIEIIPALYNDINTTRIIEHVKLEDLKDWTMENSKAITVLYSKTSTSATYTNVIIIILIVLIGLIISYKIYSNIKQKVQLQRHPVNINIATTALATTETPRTTETSTTGAV